MNGVPVLDQGKHGSCVTFANTAAIDAVLGKGDYVSQLCNLELGSYLEERSYLPSGWSGSSGDIVLHQIAAFGIINKNNQKTKSCAGVSEYPVNDPAETGNPMSLDDFKLMNEKLENVIFDSVITTVQRLLWLFKHDPSTPDVQAENVLMQIKETLAEPETWPFTRTTFGSYLIVNHCSAGACARYHEVNDTWALTKEIVDDDHPKIGAHEMVITGYDDDAIAVDNEGIKHQGLLILRNSWGDDAGDHGNYYMTYDFFKKLFMEVQIIMGVPEKQ